MRLNKRGVALLQVLIISAVLAGLSAMILRAVLSRTMLARQTRRTVTAQMIIESCMAEVNEIMSTQSADEFVTNIDYRYENGVKGICRFNEELGTRYECHVQPFDDSTEYTVYADITGPTFVSFSAEGDIGKTARCSITYTIVDGVNKL